MLFVFFAALQMQDFQGKLRDTSSKLLWIKIQQCPPLLLSQGYIFLRYLLHNFYKVEVINSFFKINADIVRRWSNEIQGAINSSHPMVQFHALSLLHQIRQSDRLAVSKLVTQLTKSNIRSPLAQCSIIRYVSQVGITINVCKFYEKLFPGHLSDSSIR